MPLDISKLEFPDPMNIREASLYLSLGEQRVRTLHRENVIPADDSTGKLLFSKKDLDAFKAQPRKAGGTRKEGAAGKAYVIHVTADKLAKVQEFLNGQAIQLENRYDYSKMRAYQQKRNAAKKAAKQNGGAPTSENAPVPPTPTPAAPQAETGRRGLLGNRTK
jgi:hypothetical protein